ncbi:MAG: hypothetical protein Q8P61_05040 [Candidatus Nanopelagicales bacterium]|nr:hypothetical protein [Candidatus Nanopelagicales bacterium]
MINSAAFDHLLSQILAILAGAYFGRAALGGLLWLIASTPGRLGAACHRASLRITPALVKRTAATLVSAVGVAAVASTGMSHAMTIDRTPAAELPAQPKTDLDSAKSAAKAMFSPLVDRVPRTKPPRPPRDLADIDVHLDRAPRPAMNASVNAVVNPGMNHRQCLDGQRVTT